MDSGVKETSHAVLSHSSQRLGASGRLGRKRIGTKLPSSLGVPGLATVCGKRGAKSYGCQLNAERQK
jgi:hypothetical protein